MQIRQSKETMEFKILSVYEVQISLSYPKLSKLSSMPPLQMCDNGGRNIKTDTLMIRSNNACLFPLV